MATVPNDIEVCVSETPCPSLKTAPTSDISKLLPVSAWYEPNLARVGKRLYSYHKVLQAVRSTIHNTLMYVLNTEKHLSWLATCHLSPIPPLYNNTVYVSPIPRMLSANSILGGEVRYISE